MEYTYKETAEELAQRAEYEAELPRQLALENLMQDGYRKHGVPVFCQDPFEPIRKAMVRVFIVIFAGMLLIGCHNAPKQPEAATGIALRNAPLAVEPIPAPRPQDNPCWSDTYQRILPPVYGSDC